jgi:hypothetical protein
MQEIAIIVSICWISMRRLITFTGSENTNPIDSVSFLYLYQKHNFEPKIVDRFYAEEWCWWREVSRRRLVDDLMQKLSFYIIPQQSVSIIRS